MKHSQFYLTLLLTLASALTSVAQADESWGMRSLTSNNGINIEVAFQFALQCHRFEADGRSDNELRLATPVWINVMGLQAHDQVDVDVEFWRQSESRTGSSEPQLERTHRYFDRSQRLLSAGNGRFTAEMGSFAIRHSIGSSNSSWRIGQRIRIRVNGVSLIDPVSDSDRFLIFLDDQKSCLY